MKHQFKHIIPYSNHCHGFTLIDLLIVLAVIFITAGLGLPSLSSLLEKNRATNFTWQISKHVTFSRNYAINYGSAVTICPLKGNKCINDWQRDISIFVDHNLNRKLGGNDKLLKVLDDPPAIDTLLYPRRGITFRADGSINGFQSGTFRYCPRVKDSPFSQGLVVNQAGRSRYRHSEVDCLD